jgi:hypothetical protein
MNPFPQNSGKSGLLPPFSSMTRSTKSSFELPWMGKYRQGLEQIQRPMDECRESLWIYSS